MEKTSTKTPAPSHLQSTQDSFSLRPALSCLLSFDLPGPVEIHVITPNSWSHFYRFSRLERPTSSPSPFVLKTNETNNSSFSAPTCLNGIAILRGSDTKKGR